MGNTQYNLGMLSADQANELTNKNRKFGDQVLKRKKNSLLLQMICQMEIRKEILNGNRMCEVNLQNFSQDTRNEVLDLLIKCGYFLDITDDTLKIVWTKNKKIYDADECIVCFENISKHDLQDCGHFLHEECMKQCKMRCPMCENK